MMPAMSTQKAEKAEKAEQKVVLITGASSGIGLACAEQLCREGYRVYGASRSMAATPASEPPAGLERLGMDVTQAASVREAVDRVVSAEGRIDVLVNNAGYGLAGAFEELAPDEIQLQLETNFFGYLRVTQAVLPVMRRRGRGLIVNISSLAGLLGIPFQSMYSASKFAIEGWSEALRLELAGHNIAVVLVEPGDLQTGFTRNRVMARGANPSGPYGDDLQRSLAVMEADERKGPGPEVVARIVARVVRSRAPRLRYRAGNALQCAAVGKRHWLPERSVEWALRRYYRLHERRRSKEP